MTSSLSPLYSTFAGTVEDGRILHVSCCDATLLCMLPGEQLCFGGAAKVAVIAGRVTATGFSLWGDVTPAGTGFTSPTLVMYSPFWDSSAVVRAEEGRGSAASLPTAAREALSRALPPGLGERAVAMAAASPNTIILALWEVEGAASCADGYHLDAGPHEAAVNAAVGLVGVHLLYDCSNERGPATTKKRVEGSCVAIRRPLWLPGSWDAVGSAILADHAAGLPSSTLVCGAKGVGKSTFCRYLVNRLLSLPSVPCVWLLDLDVGQPECGAPGSVALHRVHTPLLGPPYTHMDTPTLSFFIGDVSPQAEPQFYLAAGQRCVDAYRSACGAAVPAPLIVNSQGWVTGLGLDMLNRTAHHVQPRHVVQICGASNSKVFAVTPPPAAWVPVVSAGAPPACLVHTVSCWDEASSVLSPVVDPRTVPDDPDTPTESSAALASPPAPDIPSAVRKGQRAATQRAPRSPVDLRNLRLLSYFLPEDKWKLDLPSTRAPVRGPLSVAHALCCQKPYRVPWAAVAVHIVGGEVPYSEVLSSLNGAVVGLVVDEALPPPPAHSTHIRMLPVLPLAPCVGLAIVRAIDPVARELFLLTPVPPHILSQAGPIAEPHIAGDLVSVVGVGGAMMKTRTTLKRRRLQA